MFVVVFERELGDAGFVEFAEVFGDHAVVLFLCGARERQIEAQICARARARTVRFRVGSNPLPMLRFCFTMILSLC